MLYDYHLGDDVVQTHARSVALHKDFEIACAVDPDPDRRMQFGAAYNAVCYETIDDLLGSSARFDTVIVSTDTNNLVGVSRQFAEDARTGFMIIEKPVSLFADEIEELAKLLDDKRIKCAVNYFRPSLPEFIGIKARYQSGEFGNLQTGYFCYCKGAFHNASHFVNLLGDIFGFESLLLRAAGPPHSCKLAGDVDIDFDLAVNGKVVAVRCVDADCYEIFSGALFFENAVLSIDDGGSVLRLRLVMTGPGGTRALSEAQELVSNFSTYQSSFLDEFVKFCNGGPASINTIGAALQTAQLLAVLRTC